MLFSEYQRGAYYPTRHFEHVINSLVNYIRSSGGEVSLNQEVTSFLQRGKSVIGVNMHDRISGSKYKLFADKIVSNIDPKRTIDNDRFQILFSLRFKEGEL